MKMFDRKEYIILKSEQQKDAYIERLDNAHVDYNVFEDRDVVFHRDVTYIIQVKASDLKKVS